MSFLYRREQGLLFLGDILVFTGSLWVALLVRHFVAPSPGEFWEHLLPFAVLFVLWLGVFVMVGLYDRHVALFEQRLPATITEAQIINLGIAVLFFFLAPIAIQPKTILGLYFVISTALIVVWRLGLFRYRLNQSGRTPALLVGEGPDMEELMQALCTTPHTRISPTVLVDSSNKSSGLAAEIQAAVETQPVGMIIADTRILPHLSADSSKYDIIDAADLYEALFNRVSLSMLDRQKFALVALSRGSRWYDALKRLMDIVATIIAGIPSLVFYPLIGVALKIQDGGVLFYRQTRVGLLGKPVVMLKFRSMSGTDQGKELLKSKLVVTPFGKILRKSRVDEVPQLWNVLVGDFSLIGPRPEFPELVAEYEKQIPNYDLRHMVKPGLSGWAQVYHDNHPHHGTDVDATREKLSYDLYYIKHRSLLLDFDIAIKTIKTLALRVGA